MPKSHILAGLLSTAVACAAAAPAAADTIRLSVGAGHPASSLWIGSFQQYFLPKLAERVAAETDHTIEWTEAWGGSLCKVGECLEAVETGILDIAEVAPPFEPSKLMALNFPYFIPFAASDPVVAAKVNYQVYEDIPALGSLLEERYNQLFLSVGVYGNYGLATAFEWDELSDLDNRKISVAGPNIPWAQAVGIVPVQSNLTEAYTSVQTGVYEGLLIFPDGITSFKLEEVMEQFTVTDFGSIGGILFTINRDTWLSLPEDVQAIMMEVGRDWNEEMGRVTAERQQQSLDAQEAAGVRIKRLTPEQKQDWAARIPNLPKQRFDEIEASGQPSDAIYHYIDLLKQAGHEFPRDWSAER